MEEFYEEILNIADDLKESKIKIKEIDKKMAEPDTRIEAIDEKIKSLDNKIEEFEKQINDYSQSALDEINIRKSLDEKSAEYKVTERKRIEFRNKVVELYGKQDEAKKNREELQKEKENLQKEKINKVKEEKEAIERSLSEKVENFKKAISDRIEELNIELEKNEIIFKNVSIILERFESRPENEKDANVLKHIEEYTNQKKMLDEKSRQLLNQKRKLQALNREVLAEKFEELAKSIEDKGLAKRKIQPKQEAGKEEPPVEEVVPPKFEEPPVDEEIEPPKFEEPPVDEEIEPPKFEEPPVEEEFRSLLDDGVLDEEVARANRKVVVKPKVEERENDDFASIEKIFSGRDVKKQQPIMNNASFVSDGKFEAATEPRTKRENSNPKKEIFVVSRVEINESNGQVSIFDLDGKNIFENTYDSELIKRFQRFQKFPVHEPNPLEGNIESNRLAMYDQLTEIMGDFPYLEEERDKFKMIDPRVIDSLFEVAVRHNSKATLETIKEYMSSIMREDSIIPFEMNYNLKNIYNTELSLADIDSIQDVSNAAQQMNKERVSIRKDFILKRAFGRVKKSIEEKRIERKALNKGQHYKNKGKRIITGIYKNNVIHGMNLKGKLTKEKTRKTKRKVRTFESEFMENIDVREYLAEKEKAQTASKIEYFERGGKMFKNWKLEDELDSPDDTLDINDEEIFK